MVELRKRKTVAPAAISVAKRKRTQAPVTKPKAYQDAPLSPAKSVVKVGDVVDLKGFGGNLESNDGIKTTLKDLVDNSKTGVVLFTYPKASTPGCTKQACLFRDSHEELTSTGLSIYGLSTDSPKANTTFKTKQNLPYPLICDTACTLIEAIGFKKTPRGTIRGVVVIDKSGTVLVLQPGGPDATLDAVRQLVLSTESKDGKFAD